MTLTDLSDISQIAVLALAIFATAIAYHQAQSTAALTLFQNMQGEQIRAYRSHVIVTLTSKSYNTWDQNDRAAASAVAASYEVMGSLLRRRMAPPKMFLRFYRTSFLKCLPIIEPFLNDMEAQVGNDPTRHEGLRWLEKRICV